MRFLLPILALALAGCSATIANDRQVIVQMAFKTPAMAYTEAEQHCSTMGKVPRLVSAERELHVYNCELPEHPEQPADPS